VHQEIIISGFGGQGALFGGQLLAHAAMDSGRHVTWIPSYGPEMRGGRARCTVIVSDDPIGSPVTRTPDGTVVLNIPSMEAFEPAVKAGGTLVINSSLIPTKSEREDIKLIYTPATDIAREMGYVRLANVICLGALIGSTNVVSIDSVEKALEDNLPARHRKMLGVNKEALRKGAELAKA